MLASCANGETLIVALSKMSCEVYELSMAPPEHPKGSASSGARTNRHFVVTPQIVVE